MLVILQIVILQLCQVNQNHFENCLSQVPVTIGVIIHNACFRMYSTQQMFFLHDSQDPCVRWLGPQLSPK